MARDPQPRGSVAQAVRRARRREVGFMRDGESSVVQSPTTDTYQCEYWHKTSTLNMPRPEFLGAPAPNWLLKRDRLVPMTSIIRDAQRDEQAVSSGSK